MCRLATGAYRFTVRRAVSGALPLAISDVMREVTPCRLVTGSYRFTVRRAVSGALPLGYE
jgi:hypothetical protein